MQRRTLAWASALLLIAVALGAFGAHALRARLTPEALALWHTGVQYQFIHALGLLALAAMADRISARVLRVVLGLFVAGICCFSGSLYLLSVRDFAGLQGWAPVLGPITPLGGTMFIAGWALLLITALKPAPQD
jgi:uncharacterized membrane protein YgdD (TMEM256/DUF423 family)